MLAGKKTAWNIYTVMAPDIDIAVRDKPGFSLRYLDSIVFDSQLLIVAHEWCCISYEQ